MSDKPYKKNLDIKNTDVRKSIESLEDKKITPPPVTKKPIVPVKKSPSITTVTNNLLSGFKSKVKGTNTDKSQDNADGAGNSKAQVAEIGERNVIGEKIFMKIDKTEEFDTLERSAMLMDPRARRAKAPNRRPPSSSHSLSFEQPLNGSDHDIMPSDINENEITANSSVEVLKPKTREWEKHKAPWMEELKASQAKKTSPGHVNVEPRSPSHIVSSEQENNISESKSVCNISFKGTSNQQQTTTVELRSQNIEKTTDNVIGKSIPSAISRISINEKLPISSENCLEPLVATRNSSPTNKVHKNEDQQNNKVSDLEDRISKLEKTVTLQGALINELTKQLSEEATKVKILKMQLEKYAQCVTQV